MTHYRTRTYIAADWDNDCEVVEKLRSWNSSDYWNLSFTDAHELTQARDSSLPCTVKRSLKERLNCSKTFVLVVGDKTNSLSKGGCQLCDDYLHALKDCLHDHAIDYRSYIRYECEQALKDGLNIVVLYNAAKATRSLCPESLRDKGKHIPVYLIRNGRYEYNYSEIRDAING